MFCGSRRNFHLSRNLADFSSGRADSFIVLPFANLREEDDDADAVAEADDDEH